jgi:hypothetical protein
MEEATAVPHTVVILKTVYVSFSDKKRKWPGLFGSRAVK